MVGVCFCEHHGRAALADVFIFMKQLPGDREHTTSFQSVSVRFRMGNFGRQQDAGVIFTLSYCASCATEPLLSN